MSGLPADSQRFAINLNAIKDAAERIREHVIRTAVVTCPALDQQLNTELFFKCENLQHANAFKSRGACNAVFSLQQADADRGVVAHSSGNHAAALARAAGLRGINARIVMPHNSRQIKIDAVRRFGMEPDFCEPDSQSREAAAQRIIDETGAVLIHPFNNADVMAGQGTAALELLQQVASATDSAGNTLDTVIVPVGGGGLLAGTLIAIKSLQPDIRVIAAEPAWADDAFRSIRSGQIEQPSRYDTIADGLRTNLGSMTFPVIRELVDDIMLVEEDFIRDAAYSFLNDARLVVEPSGAVPLGCVMQHAEQFSNQRIGIIISGGNIDLSGVTL